MSTTRKDGKPRKLTPGYYRAQRVAVAKGEQIERVAKAHKRKARNAPAR